MSPEQRVVVVGGGIGGLSAALWLRAKGLDVTLLEKEPRVGGKMREVDVDGHSIDAGPTVITMPWVFEELFEQVGSSLSSEIRLQPLDVLARHFWPDGATLDLYADVDRSASAIESFTGNGDGHGYRRYVEHGRRIYDLVSEPFIYSKKPSMTDMVRAMRSARIKHPGELDLHRSMWSALGSFFHDERLRQLFGRYATYYGSSPFKAPGTLNLIAHVEQRGVWIVDGGIYRLADAMKRRLEDMGVHVGCGVKVEEIASNGHGVEGVVVEGGETIPTKAVVLNADVGALRRGLFGAALRRAVKAPSPRHRTLSAVTFALVADVKGYPLMRHNVFFSSDYAGEFRDIFGRRTLPAEPTVYVCAQDRDIDGSGPEGRERLLILVNAPARGDVAPFDPQEIERCKERTFALLSRCGLSLTTETSSAVVTTPEEFNELFPATGGALYGTATHGLMASFRRPGSRTRVPGLYLSGGSVHPGAGVPMTAISGKLAAEALLEDRGSIWS